MSAIKPGSAPARRARGQASLIMILVLAMAFIFYAISLNWGRMASLKTSTWMTATSAASQVASMFASYGERVMWENLLLKWGGDVQGWPNLTHCEHTWLFIKLLVIVIVVVIMVVAHQWELAPYLVVLVAVLMVAALVIDYAVVRPMEFAMWNKLQQNMSTLDQFRESGISAGMQSLSTDSALVPDRFDWDGNGLWGFDNNGKAKDKIGRYAFYYTERLKFIKPPDNSAYEAFRQAMARLISRPQGATPTTPKTWLGFNPYCTASNPAAPQCDSQCTGISNRPSGGSSPNVGLGWRYGYGSQNQTQPYVPDECKRFCWGSTCPPLAGALPPAYDLLYDPSLEIPPPNNTQDIPDPSNPGDTQNSFRFRLGHDDEVGKDKGPSNPGAAEPVYSAANATGVVFPMLDQMDSLSGFSTAFNTINGLSWKALANPTTVPANIANTTDTDAVNIDSSKCDTNATPPSSDDLNLMSCFKAKDIDCAEQKDSKYGFFWKKGADRYCSGKETDPAYQMDAASLKKQGYTDAELSNVRHWPYNQCEYMFDSNGAPQSCQAGTASLWPQDRLDDFVYELSDFIKFNQYLQGLSTQEIDAPQQWYYQAANYIAPQCSNDACTGSVNACKASCPSGDSACSSNCDLSCHGVDYTNSTNPIDQYVKTLTNIYPVYANSSLTCNPSHQGYMIQWLYDLTNWANLLSDSSDPTKGWLNQRFGNAATDLCAGTLSDITTCLANNAVYTAQLDACRDMFPPTTTAVVNGVTVTNYPPMPSACIDVLRLGYNYPLSFFETFAGLGYDPTLNQQPEKNQLLAINDSTDKTVFPTEAVTYPLIKTWVFDNALLKDAVTQRSKTINAVYSKAMSALDLFREGASDFGDFLAPGGPADSVMSERLTQTSSTTRLPAFAIYGWKDDKVHKVDNTRQDAWHLSRMEVIQPNVLPEIHTYQDFEMEWYGPEIYSCYEYRYGYGDVWTRATRWDGDTAGGLANFANGLKIWRFRYNNPNPPNYTPYVPAGDRMLANQLYGDALKDPTGTLNQYCAGLDPKTGNLAAGNPVYGLGIGMTQDTKQALIRDFGPVGSFTQVPALTDPNSDEAKSYQNAFMIDYDPRVSVPADQPYVDGCSCPVSLSCGTTTQCPDEINNWSNCCDQKKGYWGSYWKTYCQQTNQARYDQNMKNAELRCIQDQTKKCFYVANALLSQGVQSSGGAEFWVPNTGMPYHEQIQFKSSSESEGNFDASNTKNDQ